MINFLLTQASSGEAPGFPGAAFGHTANGDFAAQVVSISMCAPASLPVEGSDFRHETVIAINKPVKAGEAGQ